MQGKAMLNEVLTQLVTELNEIILVINKPISPTKEESFDNLLYDLVDSYLNVLLDCRLYKTMIDKKINKKQSLSTHYVNSLNREDKKFIPQLSNFGDEHPL